MLKPEKKAAFMSLGLSLILSFISVAAHAGDVTVQMTRFLNGLAAIIESNMAAPEKCVSEVDAYYSANRATVEKIRRITEEGMKKASAFMRDYANAGSMNEENIRSLEARSKRATQNNAAPNPGSDRYTKALRVFTEKYPSYGMRIAMKAMRFMPYNAGHNRN